MCALRVNAKPVGGWLCTGSLDKPSPDGCGRSAGAKVAAAEQGTDLLHVVALLGAAVVAVPLFKRAGLGSVLGYLAAGLVIGPFGLGLFTDPAGDPARRRARRGDVPVRHRARDAAVAAVEPAARDLRSRRRAGRWSAARCSPASASLAGFPPAVAFIAAHGLRALLDRHRHADPGRARRHRDAAGPARWCRSCCSKTSPSCRCWRWWRSWRRRAPQAERGGALARDRHRARRHRGAARGRPLAAQSDVPRARRRAGARGDDGGGAAGRARRGAGDAARAACRWRWARSSPACCCRNRPSAISSRPTSSRSAASCSALFFLGVGMSLDLAVIARHWPLILAGVPAYMLVKAAGIYVVARLFKREPPRGASIAPSLLAQGGEFAFVLYAAAADVGLFDATTNAILTATVIISMALTPLGVFALRWLLPDEAAVDGRRRRRRGPARQRADHRLRPLRPGGEPVAAGARHRRLDHRHRHRDDPRRRRRSASRSITATAAGSTCCAPPAPARPRRSWSASTSATPPTASSRSSRPSSRWRSSWCAPSTASTRSSWSRPASTCRSARPSNRRSNSARSRCASSACPKTRRRRPRRTSAAAMPSDSRSKPTGGLLAGRDLLHGNVPRPVPFTTPRRPRAAAGQPADGVEKSG